jgi:hypothetical protein
MALRIKHNNVVGETTVIRLKKSGEAETWLLVETSCEANDPVLRDIVAKALAIVSADNGIDGAEVLSTQAR